MSTKPTSPPTPSAPPKKRLMPIPTKRQSFEKALEETNKQYAETLAKLAK